jgi:plasmid maintenance system antidote protein VapI
MNPLTAILHFLNRRKMSTSEMAKKMGVNTETLEETIAGDKNVTPFFAERLQKAFGFGRKMSQDQIVYKSRKKK